ncbi:hypothetical protein A9K55_005617 [Cordyceps militaris]|uniref:Uncharacterized protein n=1 Tax=Cordyceps militaris TaxID=73501 RepID=A0A2H4SAV1_CORMI|nr:hypothetical protein A9K55_005617 [Cordyceps militaris]
MSHRSKNTAGKPQFEIPALNLNFGSITDGTNIPPPPPSPKVPTPPQTPPTVNAKDVPAHGPTAANKANGINTESQLPGSQSVPVLDDVDRPQSRGGFSLMGDRKSKRNSGWFKRFRHVDQPPSSPRRSSFIMGGSSSNLPAARQLEPPPPMIPELRDLEKDEGSLGSDIFRNIK